MKGLVGEHLVELKIGDLLVDTWQRFRNVHDMTSPADTFDMTFGVATWDPRVDPEPIINRIRAAGDSFEKVELFIDGAKQLTGYLDTINGVGTGDGAAIHISGRDVGGQVVDRELELGFNVKGLFLLDILEMLLGEWNIPVIIGNDDNRVVVTTKKKTYTVKDLETAKKQKWYKDVVGKPWSGYEFSTSGTATDTLSAYVEVVKNRKIAKELKPKPDDTYWNFIQRLLRTQHLLGWFGADGSFIVGTPDYDQAPLFRATNVIELPGMPPPTTYTTEMNNTEGGDWAGQPGQRYSHVYVFGKQGKEPIKAVAMDEELVANKVNRPHYHRDRNITSIEEARRVAQRLLVESQIKGTALEYPMAGFGQGDYLYGFDTVWDVYDDEPSRYIHDQMYCPKVIQEYDMDNLGPRTTVTLQPKGIIEVPTS